MHYRSFVIALFFSTMFGAQRLFADSPQLDRVLTLLNTPIGSNNNYFDEVTEEFGKFADANKQLSEAQFVAVERIFQRMLEMLEQGSKTLDRSNLKVLRDEMKAFGAMIRDSFPELRSRTIDIQVSSFWATATISEIKSAANAFDSLKVNKLWRAIMPRLDEELRSRNVDLSEIAGIVSSTRASYLSNAALAVLSNSKGSSPQLEKLLIPGFFEDAVGSQRFVEFLLSFGAPKDLQLRVLQRSPYYLDLEKLPDWDTAWGKRRIDHFVTALFAVGGTQPALTQELLARAFMVGINEKPESPLAEQIFKRAVAILQDSQSVAAEELFALEIILVDAHRAKDGRGNVPGAFTHFDKVAKNIGRILNSHMVNEELRDIATQFVADRSKFFAEVVRERIIAAFIESAPEQYKNALSAPGRSSCFNLNLGLPVSM